MNVGIFMWEPGLSVDAKASSGGASWTRTLIDYLNRKGDRCFWFNTPIPTGTQYAAFADGPIMRALDVVLFYWRWAMPEYPDRARLYHDQWSLLYRLVNENVPVVIFDGDHKIEPYELDILQKMGAHLYAPELFPKPGFKSLIFPNPYQGHPEVPRGTPRKWAIGYIGNNYERYSQTKKYLQFPSTRFNVALYGNWLEAGKDGRESPAQVLADFPKTSFPGRVANSDVISTLASFAYTIHLFKPSYGPTGFLTMRWLEAAVAGVPAFVPLEFRLPVEMDREFVDYRTIVADGVDITDSIYHDYLDHRDVVAMQRELIYPLYRVEAWREALLNAAERGKHVDSHSTRTEAYEDRPLD